MLYFIIPFIILVVVTIFFLRHSIFAEYAFPLVISVVILGGLGIYAAAEKLWDTDSWIFYMVIVLLLAIYVFAMQSHHGLGIIAATILMAAVAGVTHALFNRLIGHNSSTVLNFLGVV